MSNEISRTFVVTIAGPCLLMHNGQLADPLNPHAKALKAFTSKKKKSDEDHLMIAELEFQGGLYFDDTMGPYVAGEALDAVMKEGARKKKLGTIFESCVATVDAGYPLIYEGPRTREGLWADPRFRDRRGVGVQTSRVIRTRPKFNKWSLKFEVQIFPSEINPENVRQAIIDGGRYVGLLNFRPHFGLFNLVDFTEKTAESEKKSKKAA